MGLLLMTIAACVVTYLSAKKGKNSLWAYLLLGAAVTMLANVMVPHLIATVIFRGYTPGVVTALLINLPVMSMVIAEALREKWVAGRKAVAFAILEPLAICAAIWVLFATA